LPTISARANVQSFRDSFIQIVSLLRCVASESSLKAFHNFPFRAVL
jgi:hypothetical protein